MTAHTERPNTIRVRVPLTFSVRGGGKSIVSPAASSARKRTDNAILVALARAHRWRQQIESGEFASITELAKAKSVNESYACRLLRLTLLAPAIVNKILNGHQHAVLNRLLRPFPVRWNDQESALALIADIHLDRPRVC